MSAPSLPIALREHLEKVYTFAIVAKTGSFRKAAQTLKRTQPSLSRSVQVLEGALGQRLLERTRVGVRPTAAGHSLLDLNLRITAELERVEHRLKLPSEEISEKLLIGSYESLAIRMWPKFARKIAKTHPGISIALKTDCDGEAMLQMIRGHQLDLALTIAPKVYRDLERALIHSDRFELYASPALADTLTSPVRGKRGAPTLSTLRRVPFVHEPDAIYGERQTINQLAWKLGLLGDQMTYELDSFASAREFIVAGVGIGLLPRWIAQPAVKSGRLVALCVPGAPSEGFGHHEFYASFRKADKDRPALRAVIDHAKQVAKTEF